MNIGLVQTAFNKMILSVTGNTDVDIFQAKITGLPILNITSLGSETVEFNKETMTVDSIFLVEQSQFTSSANEALLKGSSRMVYGSRTFEIVGVKNWTGNQHLSYYRVQLKEVK